MANLFGLMQGFVHLEGETANVNFGLDATKVFNQMMSVISVRIGTMLPLITLII